jgi:hypothetical protein
MNCPGGEWGTVDDAAGGPAAGESSAVRGQGKMGVKADLFPDPGHDLNDPPIREKCVFFPSHSTLLGISSRGIPMPCYLARHQTLRAVTLMA